MVYLLFNPSCNHRSKFPRNDAYERRHCIAFVSGKKKKKMLPHDLNTHSDVTTTTPSSGQVLLFDGSNWVNGALPVTITPQQANDIISNNSKVSADGSVNTHSDVVTTTPSSGQVLTYDGTNWINSTPAAGGTGPTNVFKQDSSLATYLTVAMVPTEITALNTTITTTNPNQEVLIRAVISFESDPDGVFLLKVDGVETGSAPAAGGRNCGIVAFPHDANLATSISQAVIQHKTTIATPGVHIISFDVRTRAAVLFYLNRTNDDLDNNLHERATSSVSVDIY